MYLVGPDLLGRGQIRKLRGYLEQAGDAAATDTACALGWGWCEYLSSNYESAKRWLDIALDVAPATFDPVNAAALRINLAVGSGDIATALASAQQATAAGSLSQRRAEVATAVGAAYTWAGKHDDAVEALTIAVARSKDEQRLTANVLALISAAINEVENGEPSAAHAAAVEAIDTAEAFGLATYHGVAPAFAVRGRTAADPDAARSDVLHAVEIARRATTDLGLAYVLTTCGDVLLEQGDDAGAALIVEARTRLDRCVDPGVAARYLARVESRHHITSSTTPTSGAARVELTDRELAVLRYLPTKLSQREIAAALYVSTNTVKTHASAIFRKLGVNDRKNAVQAARDSHLL
jgi:LuxR family maltose regulon positive regulatory protein